MRKRLLRLLPVSIAMVLGLSAASSAPVNGTATITAPAPVFGLPLTVSTSSQFAGSISSIKWGNREFINNWDHGRQLQVNAQFFNRYECYNPYEAGSFFDTNMATSSSRVLALSASGNSLESTVQMAWYIRQRDSSDPTDFCGDPADRLPCPPYTVPLSEYKLHKTVTIGFAGLPNVIEYLSDLYVPEQVLRGINNVTAVLPFDYASISSYDVVTKETRKVRGLDTEDDRIRIAATADGSAAMGFYSPELLQPYGNPTGFANWLHVVPPDPFYRDPRDPTKLDYGFACVHIGSINRYDSFNGPGQTHDRTYLVIGNLDQVKSTLGSLHQQFRPLDPEVFNWQEYLEINQLRPALPDFAAAEAHWLTYGIKEGRAGSKSFSPAQYLQLNPDVASVFGATNYQSAIEHFVSSGRNEGRATSVRISAGMQHLLLRGNRIVTGAGQNFAGQLTDENRAPSFSPKPINGLAAVTEVTAGDYTSFATRGDGTLWMWGSNRYGARGDGSVGGEVTTPVQVPIPARISTPPRAGKHAVAIGAGVYAAIDSEGQVWTWGVNWNGRLGDGTTTAHYTPSRVRRSATPGDYLTGIVTISAGAGTVAAVDADLTVWTWGAGANGALGNRGMSDSPYPVQVLSDQGYPLVGISEVACGSSGFCVALARYGYVFGWGNNNLSQLGLPAGGSASVATLIPLPAGTTVTRIAAGAAHVLALNFNGKIYGWGSNGRGQLGLGSESVTQPKPALMLSGPRNMSGIDDLAAGANFSLMIRGGDRAVFVTGENQSGQFGTGNSLSSAVPVAFGE